MYRITKFQVDLRTSELLRDAEKQRWTATVRRQDRRTSRIARALGLRSVAR